MRATFSEFSYGYAVTEELLNWHGLGITAAPKFPSLLAEAKYGWDLKLTTGGLPVFLQFKLADGLTRSSAKEIADHGLPLTPTFFRYPITRLSKSIQHTLLCRLNFVHKHVYYASPRFHLEEEFSRYYFSKTIIRRSGFIRPSSIGPLPDDDQHHVSYNRFGWQFWFLSEPKPVKAVHLPRLMRELRDEVRSAEPLASWSDRLLEETQSVLSEVGIRDSGPPPAQDTRSRLERVAHLARTHMNAQLVILQPSDKQ